MLEKQALKLHHKGNYVHLAQKYYVLRTLEKEHLAKEYPGYIFCSYT
jgi:hypothetical protein